MYILKKLLFLSILLCSWTAYGWWLHFESRTLYDLTATVYHTASEESPSKQYIGTAGMTASLFIKGCVDRIVFEGPETAQGDTKGAIKSLTFTPTQKAAAGNTCANYHVYIYTNRTTGELYAESTQP